MDDQPISSTRKTFTEHVLNFDDSTKSELMNIGQYTVLALLPVLMLNKAIQAYSPEADDSKHSAEIALEVISQTIVLFLGMLFIHRLVTFVPTYSGEEYKEVNILSSALAFLVIVLSIQSRLGEKMNILYERVMELFGYSEATHQAQQAQQAHQSQVRTSQPIHGTPMQDGPIQQPSQQHLPSYDIRGDASHPSIPQHTQPQQPQQPQQYDFSQPQESLFQEPMAANEAFGSSGGAF